MKHEYESYNMTFDKHMNVLIIGYGNIVPVTFEGKVVTLIFAIIGIPINYWYIFKLGSLFAATVMTLVRSCHKKMKYV